MYVKKVCGTSLKLWILSQLSKRWKKNTQKHKTSFMSSTEGRLTCAASPKLGENVRGKNIELIWMEMSAKLTIGLELLCRLLNEKQGSLTTCSKKALHLGFLLSKLSGQGSLQGKLGEVFDLYETLFSPFNHQQTKGKIYQKDRLKKTVTIEAVTALDFCNKSVYPVIHRLLQILAIQLSPLVQQNEVFRLHEGWNNEGEKYYIEKKALRIGFSGHNQKQNKTKGHWRCSFQT